MKKLQIQHFGTSSQGVELKGDPQNPEPITFEVKLPWGNVEISRTSDNNYWVHFVVEREGEGLFIPGESKEGEVKGFRIDQPGEGVLDATVVVNGKHRLPENFNHVAVLLGPKETP